LRYAHYAAGVIVENFPELDPRFDRGQASDWMRELAAHYERMRRAHPDDWLCIVFDIDGTILDMRDHVVRVLLAYDRERGSEQFEGLRPEDITVHESRPGLLLDRLGVADHLRADVLAYYAENLWSAETMREAGGPYPGVLGVIRWFQLQPGTVVALNTGRPETVREATLTSLNEVGRTFRVSFSSELLCMNRRDWGQGVQQAKVDGLERLHARGLRVVAVVDNEPANIRAMAEADTTGEVLFLHAETIFESHRESTPRTVAGSSYELRNLVPERELRRRVQFVWHGVNDEANLLQFLASGIGWAETDVRRDPLGRLVLRHDSFTETPWTRAERPFRLAELISAVGEHDRSLKIDLKEAELLEPVLAAVREAGLPDNRLWFNAAIDTLGREGFAQIVASHPDAVISSPVDFAAPLLLAAPDLARRFLATLGAWGVTRLSVDWRAPRIHDLLGVLHPLAWDVNIYGIPDLEAFLEASLLLPTSVTADFNFPAWNYFGRGSGENGYHEFDLGAAAGG
jgi:haloacid dehalogenase-like hydrolase